MMKFPQKRYIFTILLWILTVISIYFAILFFFKNEDVLTSFFLGISAIFAMLAIALQTFLLMGKATQDTINTIFESSNRQIERINNLINKLTETNMTLGNVASSLKIVAEDVEAKRKIVPTLYVTFVNNQNQISLRSGEEDIVEFCIHNSGPISATDVNWMVLLPPEIRIVEKIDFHRVIPQGIGSSRPGFNGASLDLDTLSAKTQIPCKIKISTVKSFVGLIEIPFKCSCTNAPQSRDKLLVNFIG